MIGNIVRRVMHIIREEMEAEQEEQDDDLAAATSGARHVSRACVHACTCCHACGLPPGALRPCACLLEQPTALALGGKALAGMALS